MSGLSDGLGSRNSIRKNPPIFCWSRGKIEPAELSRWHPCWSIVALDTRAVQKTSLVFSAGLCTITYGQWDSWVAFSPHFITKEEWTPSSPDLNPLDFGIWSYLESKVSTVRDLALRTSKLRDFALGLPNGALDRSLEALKVKLR